MFRAEEQQQAALYTEETLREQRDQAVIPQESLASESGNADQVGNMNIFTSDEVDRMGKEASLFQGGRLEKFVDSWEKLTSDPEILQIFKGLCLESDLPGN